MVVSLGFYFVPGKRRAQARALSASWLPCHELLSSAIPFRHDVFCLTLVPEIESAVYGL